MKKLIVAFATILLFCSFVWAYRSYQKNSFNGTITFVSGTEYAKGEPAQTIVKVTDRFGEGLSADWCNITIYYPNKTQYLTNQAMTQGGADGSWYYDWTAPDTVGIYEQYVQCRVGGRTLGTSKASHVSEPLSVLNDTFSYPYINIIS